MNISPRFYSYLATRGGFLFVLRLVHLVTVIEVKSFIKLVLIFFSFVLCQQYLPATQKSINTIKSEKNSYYEFEEKHGDFREVLESDIIYIYDSVGNKFELVNYDANGNLVSKTIYKGTLDSSVLLFTTDCLKEDCY